MCDVISPERRGGEKSDGAEENLCSSERERRRPGDGAEVSPPVSEAQKEVWGGEESKRGAACSAGEREGEEGGKARSHQLRRDASPFHPSFASCFASTCAVSHAASPGDGSLASHFLASLSPRQSLSHSWQAPGRQSCGPSQGLQRSFSESPLTSEKTLGRLCGLPHVFASFEVSLGGSSAFDSAYREASFSSPCASSLSFFSVHSHTALLESSGSHSQLPPHADEAPATFASLLRSSSLPPSFAESQTGSPFFPPPASAHAAAQAVPGDAEVDGVCTPECAFFLPGFQDVGTGAWADGVGEIEAEEAARVRDSRRGEAVRGALYSSLDAQTAWAEDEGGESAFCEPPEEPGRLCPRDGDAFFCAWCPSYPTPYGGEFFLPEGGAPGTSFAEFGYEKGDEEEEQPFSSFGNLVAVAPTLLHVYSSSPEAASCSLSPSHARTDAAAPRRELSASTTPSSSHTVFPPFSASRPPVVSAVSATFTSAFECLDAQGVYTPDDGVHIDGRAFSVSRASGEGSVRASPASAGRAGASRGSALSAYAPSWEELQRGALRQSFEETASTERTGETHREDEKLSSQLSSRASPFYPSSSRFIYADASLPPSGASLASASVSAAASFPLHAESECRGETERLRKPFQFSPYSSPFSPSAPSGMSLQRRDQDRTPGGDIVALTESAGRRSPLNGDSFKNACTDSFETGAMSQTLFPTNPRIRCSSFPQSCSFASSSPSQFSALSFSSSLSSTSPAFSPSSASSSSSSLSSSAPAFSPSSASSFSSSLSSSAPAFSPSSASSFSSSLSSLAPAFSPFSASSSSSSLSSSAPAFSPFSASSSSSSLSSLAPAFSPFSASSSSSSLSSSAPAFSPFSASSFSSSLSFSAPAFSPFSSWSSSSFAAPEDAISTSPMHAKEAGSPQPRAGREGTRSAWGVRSLRFYEDLALVLSSLSSASEDETNDELISNGDGVQAGAEAEEADEEKTKATRSLPRVPHFFRKTQLSPPSSKPGHRPSSPFLVPPLAASSCSGPSSPSLCSSSLCSSSLACSLPCSPSFFMRAHAPDASSISLALRVAGRAGEKRERQEIPSRFRNFPVWPPESRAWAREIRETRLPRLLNPTSFAGIEKSGKIERDFVHAVAQAVFFAPPLKDVLARHQCDRHACVACELGFLLHMLDLARKEEDPFRRVCQSTNLQRLLRDLPRMRRARVFHSCFPSDGSEVARGPFSALARRTRVFCGLLLEHLHEDLKDDSSQVASSSFSSPIDFLFHLRDTPGASAERRDEVDVASEYFLPLRYPHKEMSETNSSSSSSSSPSCSSSVAASFSSSSSTHRGDAPRSAASSLSFSEVLEHSLRVYGVRARETKRQRESVPRAGSPDGGMREEAATVSASSRDTVPGEERSVREETRSREQGSIGSETRNGEEKEQEASPMSAYPPFFFIDSNLESEADAAHWRARGRGRRAPRGVCTPEEAVREGGEEGKRSSPAFLCEEFWVKLQSSGEAGDAETLPRVRQVRFPGAVHYVLSAVLFCVRSPPSFASSPPRRKSVSLGPGCLPLDSVSHTREALSPPPLVTSSVSSSFALSSSSFSTTPSSASQPSLPSPFSFAVACPSAASGFLSSSSAFSSSSSRSSSSPRLPSVAPLSAPLFLPSPGVSASHACLSSSRGVHSNARRSEERLPGSNAACRTPGRQAAASREEAREDGGDQAKGHARPAGVREAEEERLLLFVRVPESYLATSEVSSSGGPDDFDETHWESSSSFSSSISKVSLGVSSVCTAHARGETSQAGHAQEAGREVDAKISQWREGEERHLDKREGEEGDLDESEEEEGVVLETSRCGARRLSLNRGGDNDEARKEAEEEGRKEERCTAALSERRKHSSKGTTWLLINDHVLAYVKETTVLDFSRSWKLPVLLQFTRRDCLDASSASSGALREASETCEGERGDSSGFAVSSGESEGHSTYCRSFRESGGRREAANALRGTTSRAGRMKKPGRLEEPEELVPSSVAFHLFQADENISLRPLAAKTPTTFLPLTHDELVALQLRKASPSTTRSGSSTRRGNGFASPACSPSSSTSTSSSPASSTSSTSVPSSSTSSTSSSPSSSASSPASSPSASPASSASSCSLWGPFCLRVDVDVERDRSAKRRGTEGHAGTEAIEAARCSVSAEQRLTTAVGEAEKMEFNGEAREGSDAKDEEEGHTVEPGVEEKKREMKGAATSARKTEHSGDLSSDEEDAHASPFTPLFTPGVSPEGRDRGEEEREKQTGWLVALDAEFVAEDLEKEEGIPLVNEFHRVKPVSTESLALARVSVLRGEGPQAGVPFIDHYVHFKVAPKDYLTRFSGLRPGDLDLHASQFWLSTKKAIHQKLRYLVDAGCVFVGHGLSQDFRIINLFVPSSQIIDTVELFRLPGRRLLSLKFLAAHLLDLRIQQTTHDSVEDARSALLLYRRYNELRRSGTLEQCIQHLYRIGYSTKWRVPDPPAVLPLSPHCSLSSAHSSRPSSASFPSSLPLPSSGPVRSRLSPEALPFVFRCGAGRRQQLSSSLPAVGLEREAEETERISEGKGEATKD